METVTDAPMGAEGVLEKRPLPGKGIDLGCGQPVVAVAAHVVGAQ